MRITGVRANKRRIYSLQFTHTGCGRVQCWDQPIQEIRAGDVVWIPAGEKHWHGAAPTTALTHSAIHEHLDGKNADWLEQVSDAQYHGE